MRLYMLTCICICIHISMHIHSYICMIVFWETVTNAKIQFCLYMNLTRALSRDPKHLTIDGHASLLLYIDRFSRCCQISRVNFMACDPCEALKLTLRAGLDHPVSSVSLRNSPKLMNLCVQMVALPYLWLSNHSLLYPNPSNKPTPL